MYDLFSRRQIIKAKSYDRTLSLSTVSHIIKAPFEKVNIADWLFNLPDAEYQRCSHAHIAAGHTTSDDGRLMSINVETIGEALMVQHFVAQVLQPHFCRLTSISDAITMMTKVHLLWELSAKKIDHDTCEYSNHIHATATDEFLAFIEKNGVTFEQARAARQQAYDSHKSEVDLVIVSSFAILVFVIMLVFVASLDFSYLVYLTSI